jgi:hypothetical protein
VILKVLILRNLGRIRSLGTHCVLSGKCVRALRMHHQPQTQDTNPVVLPAACKAVPFQSRVYATRSIVNYSAGSSAVKGEQQGFSVA